MIKINRFTKFAYIMSLIAVLSFSDVVYANFNATEVEKLADEDEREVEGIVISDPEEAVQGHQNEISKELPTDVTPNKLTAKIDQPNQGEIYISEGKAYTKINGQLVPLTESNVLGQYETRRTETIGGKKFDVLAPIDLHSKIPNINIPAAASIIKNESNKIPQAYILSGDQLQSAASSSLSDYKTSGYKTIDGKIYTEFSRVNNDAKLPQYKYVEMSDVAHKPKNIAQNIKDKEKKEHFKGYQVAVISEAKKPEPKTFNTNINIKNLAPNDLAPLVSNNKNAFMPYVGDKKNPTVPVPSNVASAANVQSIPVSVVQIVNGQALIGAPQANSASNVVAVTPSQTSNVAPEVISIKPRNTKEMGSQVAVISGEEGVKTHEGTKIALEYLKNLSKSHEIELANEEKTKELKLKDKEVRKKLRAKAIAAKNEKETSQAPVPVNTYNPYTQAELDAGEAAAKAANRAVKIAVKNEKETSPAPAPVNTYNPYTQAEMNAGEAAAKDAKRSAKATSLLNKALSTNISSIDNAAPATILEAIRILKQENPNFDVKLLLIYLAKNSEVLSEGSKRKLMTSGNMQYLSKNGEERILYPTYTLDAGGNLQTEASPNLDGYKGDGFKEINGEVYAEFKDIHNKSKEKYVKLSALRDLKEEEVEGISAMHNPYNQAMINKDLIAKKRKDLEKQALDVYMTTLGRDFAYSNVISIEKIPDWELLKAIKSKQKEIRELRRFDPNYPDKVASLFRYFVAHTPVLAKADETQLTSKGDIEYKLPGDTKWRIFKLLPPPTSQPTDQPSGQPTNAPTKAQILKSKSHRLHQNTIYTTKSGVNSIDVGSANSGLEE